MITPLHVAEINGERLRFFKTPFDDGKPDLPWHAVDDLYRIMKLPRSLRRHFRERIGAARTIATAEGIIGISPHYQAQGAIKGMIEMKQAPASLENDYATVAAEAMEKLTHALPFAFPSEEWLAWMAAAMKRWEGKKP
jgi:hypothetical protein